MSATSLTARAVVMVARRCGAILVRYPGSRAEVPCPAEEPLELGQIADGLSSARLSTATIVRPRPCRQTSHRHGARAKTHQGTARTTAPLRHWRARDWRPRTRAPRLRFG